MHKYKMCLCVYIAIPSTMSRDTSATAIEILVSYFKIYSLLRRHEEFNVRQKCKGTYFSFRFPFVNGYR